MKILDQALETLRPTTEQVAEAKKIITEAISKVNKNARPAKTIVGGSGAKNTFLRGEFDVDLFVLYPYKKFASRSAEISDKLEVGIKKAFPGYERIHGSRDYFRAKFKGIQFEIIPILDIKKSSDAVNITDVSPLHSKWVLKKSTKGMNDQIRLMKAFCKGSGVYGAESYIRGFSGYVCEILTIHYGSFTKVLKASKKWLPGTVIDTMKLLKGKPAFSVLNKSKIQSPLIIIDPVQSDRNAAAALDMEAFERFRKKAVAFSKKPTTEYFERKFLGEKEIIKKYPRATVLKVTPIDGKEDVAGSSLYKTFQYLEQKTEKSGFKLKDSDWEWDKKNHAYFWFIPKKEPLDPEEIKAGPPIKLEEHAKTFKKLYTKAEVKRGRLYAKVPRTYTFLKAFYNDLKNDPLIVKRTKDIEII